MKSLNLYLLPYLLLRDSFSLYMSLDFLTDLLFNIVIEMKEKANKEPTDHRDQRIRTSGIMNREQECKGK